MKEIPIPTDNIYKFYALFGLVLFIFSFSSILYINRSTNDLIFNSIIEKESIQMIKNKTIVDEAKLKTVDKRLEIAIKDKEFFITCLNILGGVAIALSVYGFWYWQRILQPIQDETNKLQLEKLSLEIEQMKRKKHVPFRKNNY